MGAEKPLTAMEMWAAAVQELMLKAALHQLKGPYTVTCLDRFGVELQWIERVEDIDVFRYPCEIRLQEHGTQRFLRAVLERKLKQKPNLN